MEDSEKQKIMQETEAYLTKIKKTVSESRALVESATLRMAETDRLLASQGLTREEVMNLKFTKEQTDAVNAELRRRGLPELTDDEAEEDGWSASYRQQAQDVAPAMESALRERSEPVPGASDDDGTTENRRRKFGVMMQQFRM